MGEAQRIRIELTPKSTGSRVFVDDVEIQGLRSVEVRAGIDEVSIVKLEFVQPDVVITGDVGEVRRA